MLPAELDNHAAKQDAPEQNAKVSQHMQQSAKSTSCSFSFGFLLQHVFIFILVKH